MTPWSRFVPELPCPNVQNGYSSGGFISDVEAWGEMKNSIRWDVADALELSSPIGIHFEHTLFN